MDLTIPTILTFALTTSGGVDDTRSRACISTHQPAVIRLYIRGSEQQDAFQSSSLRPYSVDRSKGWETRAAKASDLDVSASQNTVVHSGYLPTVRTFIEYLSSPISLLPHTVFTTHRRYEPGFHFTTSRFTCVSVRPVTIYDLCPMGEFRQSLRQETYNCHWHCPLDHFQCRLRILNNDSSRDVLEDFGRIGKWQYWRDADDDS